MKTFICKIPLNLPLPKGGATVQSRITHFNPGIGPLAPDGIIPLFGKWFDETHHPELVEGEGLAPWSGESYSTGQGEIF